MAFVCLKLKALARGKCSHSVGRGRGRSHVDRRHRRRRGGAEQVNNFDRPPDSSFMIENTHEEWRTGVEHEAATDGTY